MLFTVTSFAQSNEMKARMEYEDAETAYHNANYGAAVTHLENAEKLLGKPTSKTRYLLVLALSKNLPKDYDYKDLEKLKTLTKHYLDQYHTVDTGKYREIYDLQNYLEKAYPKDLAAYNKIQQDKKDKEEQLRLTKQKERENLKNSIQQNMMAVAGGTFNMGSKKEYNEKPIHAVTLSSYSIGKYPVTVAQYHAYCNAIGKEMPAAPSWGWVDSHPMVNVSWGDAVAYTQWLGKEFGGEWRLPTEAEWEYAARGGNQSQDYIYSGSNNIDEVAWYSGNSGEKTNPVGAKTPNELGIYDMSGNVWEWCNDWYGLYSKDVTSNPKGPTTGSSRVLRGSDWYFTAEYCRVAYRFSFSPDKRGSLIGFRVVISQ